MRASFAHFPCTYRPAQPKPVCVLKSDSCAVRSACLLGTCGGRSPWRTGPALPPSGGAPWGVVHGCLREGPVESEPRSQRRHRRRGSLCWPLPSPPLPAASGGISQGRPSGLQALLAESPTETPSLCPVLGGRVCGPGRGASASPALVGEGARPHGGAPTAQLLSVIWPFQRRTCWLLVCLVFTSICLGPGGASELFLRSEREEGA